MQCGLGSPANRPLVVGDIQGCLLRVQHLPEQYCIHIHGDGILGKGPFRIERGCDHPDIDPVGDGINDRNNEKQTRAFQRVEFAQPQNDCPFPLVGNLDRGGNDQRNQKGNEKDPAAFRIGEAIQAIGQAGADGKDNDEDQRLQ